MARIASINPVCAGVSVSNPTSANSLVSIFDLSSPDDLAQRIFKPSLRQQPIRLAASKEALRPALKRARVGTHRQLPQPALSVVAAKQPPRLGGHLCQRIQSPRLPIPRPPQAPRATPPAPAAVQQQLAGMAFQHQSAPARPGSMPPTPSPLPAASSSAPPPDSAGRTPAEASVLPADCPSQPWRPAPEPAQSQPAATPSTHTSVIRPPPHGKSGRSQPSLGAAIQGLAAAFYRRRGHRDRQRNYHCKRSPRRASSALVFTFILASSGMPPDHPPPIKPANRI